jgi:benzil reductase ((S)-benzoin forming)
MDMMSEVIYTEQKQIDRKKATYIFSIAPGIVETQMQDEIRAVSKEKFKNVDTFIEYKEKGYLIGTNEVAVQIKGIIDEPKKYKEPILDLRSL